MRWRNPPRPTPPTPSSWHGCRPSSRRSPMSWSTGEMSMMDEPETHDLTRADYSFRPADDGQRGHIASWTATPYRDKPQPGDYLILRNGDETTRYQVITMNP